MPWSRQTRGLAQRKLEKPNIKKNNPLSKDGNDGDISIRNVTSGVFSFFKALGTWFKVFNNKNHMIPDKPNTYDIGTQHLPWRSLYLSNNSLHLGNTKAEKTTISTDGTDLKFKSKAGIESKVVGKKALATGGGSSVINQIELGSDNVANDEGWVLLGSGEDFYGGVLSGVADITNLDQADYLGLRVLGWPGGDGSSTGHKALSVVTTLATTTPTVFLQSHDIGRGGGIGIKEWTTAPAAPDADYGLLYAKADGLYYITDGISAVNLLTGLSYLPLAGGALTGDITITDTSSPQLKLLYDANNLCTFSLDSNGATTIATRDHSTGTDGDIILDADGDIVLDSATGVFIAKNNGTEFSVANSSYAGMILGYTTVGIGQAPASFDVTDAMLPVHDDLKVTFKAPPSGVVEIMVSIYVDTDSPRPLTFGLSTTDASTGFASLHAKYENHTFYGDETDGQQHQHRWVITGLTPNAVDTYWFSAGATQVGRIDLRWGGDSSAVADDSEPYEYQPFIMKATALPTAVADYAVYG